MTDNSDLKNILDAEAKLLKIALCRKYQTEYSDIETLCQRAGLYPAEAAAVKKWAQHSAVECYNEINRLLSYIEYEEPERYKKALEIYKKQNKTNSCPCFI